MRPDDGSREHAARRSCVAHLRAWLAGDLLRRQRRPAAGAAPPPGTSKGEWPAYHGDYRNHHYSPLAQINADNFNTLEVAWRLKTDNFGTRPEFKLEGTPLMVGGVVYTTAGTRRAVVALDAATGELRWVHGEPEGARGAAAPRQLSGPRRRLLDRRQRGADPLRHARLPLDRARRQDRHARAVVRHRRRRRPEGGRRVRHRAADRSRQRRDRPARHARGRRRRRDRRIGVPRRAHARRRTTTPRASCRRSTCARASGSGTSTPSRGPASSATRPGKTIPGPTTATSASGIRWRSTRSSASSICRSRRRPPISTAAIGPATISSPRASSPSI